ncbi:MAG: hypothetical protein A07HB70_02101 [uncultured archaeon A07HB70]|nr:MAG: hypothetical protein A07HB70_02101 [uncultured archaeon A07HB70]
MTVPALAALYADHGPLATPGPATATPPAGNGARPW